MTPECGGLPTPGVAHTGVSLRLPEIIWMVLYWLLRSGFVVEEEEEKEGLAGGGGSTDCRSVSTIRVCLG